MNILRWFLSFIGVQLLCLVVWFVGPLRPELEEPLPRIGIIAVMAALWAIGNLALDLRRLSRERSLTAGVAGGKPEDAEAAALQEKLGTAMKTLRRARGKRGAIYEQPWYVIIGPPGAGKTTALLNAGLEFPLADQMGRGALSGVGGTRLCEWWFTDKAVLIDTAGRYTTHDSDAAVDRAGWEAFLDLLKRTRPKQPLNGVIVAIALADVVGDSAGADRLLHARAIRRRIVELETKLGVRLPVYALLTKSDLLAGFTEFFGDLDREAREQVWGVTLPYRKGAIQDAVAAFSAEAKRWVGVLEQRMLARLQSEPNAERRALVSAFPAQFATVGAPVAEFLGEAFAPHERERPPLLRGIYLTSATQEGAPIDRLTGALARAFGLESSQARRLRPEEGRTFFLTGLLRDVIFREAMLGSASPGSRRRAMLLRSVGFVLCLLIAAGGAGALWLQRQSATADLDRVQTALADYEQEAGTLPLDPVRDADLPRLLPLLDRARALPFGADHDDDPGPLGLSQAGKLAAAAAAIYRHGLEYALLPRLLWRLEAQIRGNLTDPDFEYEATRVYLMLGGAGPLDRDLVRQWLTLDWEQTYTPDLRTDLARHLDALLTHPLPKIDLDGQVVAAARATFARVSVAQRVYSRIKPSAAAAALPPWRPADALGAAGVTVFVRASGRPMTDGIPGLFTPSGLRDVLLPALGPALQAVAAESWVLGAKTDLQSDPAAIKAAEQDVLKLYTNDYLQAWDAMLADLDIAPLHSLVQAAQDLYILASRENSPMRALLASVAQQTTMTAPPPPPPSASATERDRLAQVMGRQAAPVDVAASPVQAIDDHFKPLHDVMRPGAIDQVLKPLDDLRQQLAKMAGTANRAGAVTDPGSADPVAALQAEGLRQPQPLARWLASISASGRALRGGGVKEQITAAFKAGGGVGALCPQVVAGKYPFTPGSDKDVGLDEFGRLFGAGGVMDAFFNTQLKPYVDSSGKTWKLQPVEGASAPIAPADLQQFQTAQAIRDLFFAAGGTTPKLRLDLTPLGAEPAGSTASLDAGSVTVAAGGGPPRPAQIVWPAPNAAPARLTWVPPAGTGLQETGPWALFRLFAHGQFAANGTDRMLLTLRDADHSARFEMRASNNPFTTKLLQDFRCPTLQ